MKNNKNQAKKIISTTMLLVLLMLTGCTKEEVRQEDIASADKPAWSLYADEPIELDWYINYTWYTTPWGHNVVSKAITEETGVFVNFKVPTGDESEELNSMIASNTLPDLITLGWWEPQINSMIDNDMVYALNELADEYDPYFFKVANKKVTDWYTTDDGNFYCYPNSTLLPEDLESENLRGGNLTFLVRKDIYEAIGEPDMTTQEGFCNAVKKAAELFPYVDGEPLIPIGSDEFGEKGSNSFDKYLQNFLNVPLEQDGEFYDRFTDPEYISWLKMFRRLNQEGYLSQEIFLDKRMQLEDKLAKGRYFCLIYQGSDIHAQQKLLYENDPNSIYISVEGPRNSKGDNPIIPSTGVYGWTVTLVSKKCENPERAIAFITYFLSEHGQKRIYLGVEGETYDVVDDEYIIKPGVKSILYSNRELYDELYGADDAYWMFQNNVMQDTWGIEKEPFISQLSDWSKPYLKYTAQYDITFEKGSKHESYHERIQKEWGDTLPRLLLSKSDEEFDAILEEFVQKREGYHYKELLVEYKRQIEISKEKLGIE